MKKFLSILLSITMLLSITAGIDFSAFADDSDRIDMSDVSYKPHGIFKNDLYYTYDYDLVYYFSDSDEEDGYVLSKDDDFVEIGWASMDIDAYFECLYGDDDFNNYEFLDEPESYDEDYCLLVEGTGDFKGDSFLFVEGWNPTLTAEDGDDNGDENGDNNDEESDIKSIIFTPNEAIEIAEFTNGSLENVEGVGEYWEYNIPGFKEGDILTVVTKDDEVKNYIYKGFSLEVFDDIFVNQADKEDYIYADDIEKWSDQQSEPWEKDKENYYTISYHGAQYDVLVSIVENNVKSISFTPVVPAEYTEYKNGYYEENNDGELFWCYSIPDFNDGDILTVTDKNGVPTDYTFVSSVTGDGGNFISKKAGRISTDNIRIYDDQYNENWTVGTNYYVINYMASECIVPVTITETQVASIDFNPVSTTAYPEETNGYFNEDLGYFVYYDPQFNNGDELIVTHKDGTKYTYTYMVEDEGILGSFVDDKNDDVISIFDVLCYSQQENTPWVIDGNNYYFVSYSGATTNVPVVIKENKIQDIQVECNTKLIYQDSDEDFSFSDYASNLEFTLNITYKDDTTLSTNVRDGDIVDGEKFNLYFAYPEDDSVYYYCEYYGSEFELSTPIVDHSIVDSIEVEQLFVPQKFHDSNICLGCIVESGCLGIKINYKDGTSDYITSDKLFGVTHPKHDEDYIQTSFSDSRIMYFAGNYGGIVKFSCRLNDDFDFESSSNVTVTVYNKSAKVAVNTIMHNHVYSQEVTTQPTCTQAGEMTYRCECGDSYTEEIAKLGHKEKVTVNRTEPTCTQAGTVTENVCCEICGETLSTKSEPIAAKGHTVVTDKAVASTYAAEGKTQGSHCSECNAVLVAQKTVAKLTVPAIALSKVTSPKSKQMKVTWKKNTKVTGYEVQYSTDKNFKKGNKTVKVTKNKTTSTTIKKLKSKKKYYVRIRTYKTVNGKKYYSAWSKAKNVKVK